MAHTSTTPSIQPYQRRIFRQGVILVLVPLFFGTSVFLGLTYLKSSIEKKSLPVKAAAHLFAHLNRVFLNVSAASRMSVSRIFGYAPVSQTEVHSSLQQFDNQLNETRRLARDEPDVMSALDSGAKILELTGQVLNDPEIPTVHDRKLRVALALRKVPKFFIKMCQYADDGQAAMQRFWQKTGALENEQIKLRYPIEQFVYGSIVFNIVLCLTLVWWSTYILSRRMRKLMDNIQNLYKGAPIARCLNGGDELAYVDEVIVNTWERLSATVAHRQRILNMVAHDLRAPLMSAQGNLQLLEEFAGELTEDAINELQKTHKSMDRVLEKAQNLLVSQVEAQSAGWQSSSPGVSPAEVKTVLRISPDGSEHIAALEKHSLKDTITSLFFSPSLVQLRLLLVTALLFVQTLSLLMLSQQSMKTKEAYRLECHCINVIAYVTMIRADIQKGLVAQIDNLIRNDAAEKEKANRYLNDAVATYDELCNYNRADVAIFLRQHNLAAMESVEQSRETLRTIARTIAATDEPSEVGRTIGQAMASLCDADDRLTAEFVNLENVFQRQDFLSGSFNSLITCSLFANMVLGMLMLVVFSWRTERRLKSLMADAKLLGSRQSVEVSISGSDEIAQLDRAIHYAQQRLKTASRERAQIVKSLAEDMHSPLTETLVRLDRFKGIGQATLPEKSVRYLQLSKVSVQKVVNLLNDLLTIEQLDVGKIDLTAVDCSITEVVNEAMDVTAGLAGTKQINIADNSQNGQIVADKARLVQVLVNYITNAIKFSRTGSTVTITVQRTPSNVRFAVVDEGPGMDAKTKERVFEEHFQGPGQPQGQGHGQGRGRGQGKNEGYGLGLAICKLIVQSHGGRLGVESKLGEGSEFWLEIPQNANK